MNTIVSFDLKADFGFLKKPDTNNPMYFTFNMLHKPALLGILGAILGLGGFSQAIPKDKKNKKNKMPIDFMPPYYRELESLKIGIAPLEAENGNFQKTTIKYNNTSGFANEDGENGATLNIVEQTLVSPSYRCFIHLESTDLHHQLYTYLKNGQAEYLPYLGKNDFSVWWDNFQEYTFAAFDAQERSFRIASLFMKEIPLKKNVVDRKMPFRIVPSMNSTFMYFENLPVSYNTDLVQYEYAAFAYTDWELKQEYPLNNLYQLDNDEIIQLF